MLIIVYAQKLNFSTISAYVEIPFETIDVRVFGQDPGLRLIVQVCQSWITPSLVIKSSFTLYK